MKIYWEGHKVADGLAKIARNFNSRDIKIWSAPPPEINRILLLDNTGALWPRKVRREVL